VACFQNIKQSLAALAEIKFPVVISVESTHAMYNHVVVVWNELVFDYETKYTYPLTKDSLRNVCSNNTSFTKITSGYGIFPSKEVRNSSANVHIEDWGGTEYYSSNGTLKKYFLSKTSNKKDMPFHYRRTNITVPYDVIKVNVHSSVGTIPSYAFVDRLHLEYVYISNGVVQIGQYAFFQCRSLGKVVISETVDVIMKGAFEECTSLKQIIIPQLITEIPESAFFRCSQLTKVELPEGLRRISTKSFSECESLCIIKIPRTVLDIHGDAFLNCKKLTHIQFCDEIEAFVSEESMKHWWNCELHEYSVRTFGLLSGSNIPKRVSELKASKWKERIHQMLRQIPSISEEDLIYHFGDIRNQIYL